MQIGAIRNSSVNKNQIRSSEPPKFCMEVPAAHDQLKYSFNWFGTLSQARFSRLRASCHIAKHDKWLAVIYMSNMEVLRNLLAVVQDKTRIRFNKI